MHFLASYARVACSASDWISFSSLFGIDGVAVYFYQRFSNYYCCSFLFGMNVRREPYRCQAMRSICISIHSNIVYARARTTRHLVFCAVWNFCEFIYKLNNGKFNRNEK